MQMKMENDLVTRPRVDGLQVVSSEGLPVTLVVGLIVVVTRLSRRNRTIAL